MSKKNEYTEERLLQAYSYEMQREKSNRENGNPKSAAGVTYTQKNLLDAYYKETGHRISEPAYSMSPKSHAKKTVQADEDISIQKMQENARQLGDNKDQYGMFSPQEAIMNASLNKHLNADSLSNPLTSKMTANTISDEAMNVAINMLKNKQTEANHEFSDKFISGQMIADELPEQMKHYKDALDVYETEKEARAVAQDNERQEMYNTRRENVLEELPEDARKLVDTYTESEAMYNATTISNADAMMRLNYSKAMQDAKAQLSEEYGIEGAELQRVLQYAKELSDKENTEELQSQVQKDIEEHPVLAGAAYTAMDVLASPATGIMAATESLKHQGYADKGAPVNTNSAEYGLMNFSNTTEQAINEQIENPVGRFAYNVGTSTAKSALSAAIGGEVVGALGLTGTAASVVGNIVTLPQFGASAYASTLQEDQEKGISTENATKHAVAAGVGEMLFEVASLDKVWSIANRSGKVAAKQVLMDILVEAGIEGSEEGFTDIWNRVADDIINGSQSDYNMSVNAYIKSGYSDEEARAQASKDFYAEVALDVLAGAASGGIMGGGANIVSAINYHNLGKYVDENTELKQSVYDAAQSMNEDSMTRQIIQDKSVDEMTAADIADVLHAMSEESEMDTEQILEERFVELGESKREAKADARRVIEAVSTPSEKVTEEAHEARSAEFAANENLATVYAETLKGELTKPQDAVRTAQESYASSKYYDSLIKRGKTDGTGIARATINATGEEMDVVEIHEISNGKAVVRMKDNSLKNLEDIQIEDPVKQSLYNFATSMEDAKAANAVIEEYKGQSLASYAEACAVFYNAGKVGSTSFESMMSNPKNSALVSNMSSPATLQRMYFMGENNRSAKKEKVAPVQQMKSENQSVAKAVRKEGRVIDNRTDKSDSRMADVAKQVAKRTGLEITLNDSLANGENGHFQKSLARIALSEMADNQYTTLVHEINEFAESYNPEGMKQVIDTVLDYAQTEEGAAFLFGKENGIIQRYQNVYRQRVEADKTYEGAAEEFVFDYLSGVFSSKEGVEDFSRYMTEEGMSQKEQKGILETIADFFKELADKITSYLDEHVLSKTAQKGLQADAEKAREIRQMVMDVWQQAEENYQSEEGTTIEWESEKRFSLYENFVEEVEEWYNDKDNFSKKGGFFVVGRTSEALKSIGVKDYDITWDKSKIKKILNDHEEMTIDVIKDVPNVLENPIIVMQSKTRLNSITLLGEVYADGEPVMAAMHLSPSGKKGRLLDYSKISSAYVRTDVQKLIDTSDILYVENNKNRTDKWLSAFGLRLPVGLTKYGSIGNVTYYESDVKENKGKTVFEEALERAKYDVTLQEQKKKEINHGDVASKGLAHKNQSLDKNKARNNTNVNKKYSIDESSAMAESEKSFSITVDEDGIENYTTTEKIKVLSYKERQKKLLDIMRNEYAGRTAKFEKNGEVYYALYDEPGLRKGVHGDKKSSKRGYNAKISIGAEGNYIELVENSLYHGSKQESGKTNRFHRDAKSWDYYIKTIKYENRYFDVLINVKDTGENQYVYDITLKEAGSLPDPRRSYDGSSTASSNRISQNPEKSRKKYSIDVDSEGRKLSEGQKEYFKDSKVRDEAGKLLVMYHGTPQGGFTVFKPDLHFFSQNKNYADIYQSASASSRNSRKEASNPYTYEVYLNIKNPFDIREPEARKVFINDYVKGGYALGINPYVEYKDTTSTGLPSWEEADNIYEFLEENDLLEEYDGVIVDEGAIPGENGEILSRGIAYVTFSENQIKRVDNLNPTEDKDIRYSIDIDDSLFSALRETYSAQEEEFASIIQEGFASLKNVTVNEKVIHKVAYDIKKAYKSSYDINKLQENLTRVFAYLKDNTDTVGYADMVRIVQEIAKPVIEQSTDVDAFEQELYNNFRAYLKGRRIRLSEEQKAEVAYYYGSYENFRKKNLGNITFSDEGTYLDNIWSEICDNSYQMLDIEVSTADEPIALIDALNTLRPTKKNIYGMDTEQAAYDLALDIYRRFFVEQAEEQANRKVNEKAQRLIVRQQEYRKRVKQEYDASLQRLREAEQQKRRNLAEKYEQKIHDLKEDQKAMRYYSDVKAAKEIERKVNYYTKKLVETNQKANDRILQIKASNWENMLNKRRNEELRQYRERIKKNAQGIVTMFNTNTDKKHVPEVLKEPVANFITSIDFVSERASADSAATLAWQDALNQMHRKLSDREAAVNGGYIELYNALHNWEGESRKTSALLSDMSAFIDSHYSMRLSAMNIEDLRQLNELVTGLKRAISNVNQLYVNKRTKNVQELGSSTVNELSEKKKKASRTQLGEMAENLLDVDMLDSRSYFYRLGDSAFSIYEGLRNGFSERVWMLKEAQQYMEKELDGLDVKNWTGNKAEVHKMIIQGKELYMTTGQIMSLYELKNRYQAKMHLRNGGIRPAKIGKGKGAIERITPLKLTDYEIDLICQKLTPEQKKAADAMQRFMAENCAEWGNKTSMLMYGYKRFEASNYFPIKTDGNSVDTRDDSKYYGTKNQGFTKETTSNASNAVIVSDIFDVFTKHVTDMASYSAFTAPLMDAMKWFNYRNVSYDGDIAVYGESVKSEIERAYGTQYLEYFKKLIKDINAETSRGGESQISDTLTSRMKAASVGANVRVAIQQPTAYVRAMAVMNPKYLVKALPKKSQIKKAKENSAITQWKSWGYFETSIGMSMKNVITGQDTLKNKAVEKSMTLAQIGDDVTWGYLWNACEAEINDKHPEVQYDSEEFLKLVSARFDEVVDQTQVVDSVLHRSHIMRSDNGIVKMATSFMAEPTKSYNMLMNQIRDVSEGGGKAAKKRLGNAVVAYCVTGLLNAVFVSVVDAARDMDDDDDTYRERYMDALGDNIKDNLNPFGMIPYVKDILSILQGYDVERMDMQGISNVITGAQKLYKYINDEEYRQKHTLWDVSKTLIRGTSQVLGIPVYNLLRDLESAVYTVTGVRIGGIKRSNARNYELMVDAVISDDAEKYEEVAIALEEDAVDEEQIQQGIRAELKDRYLSGSLTREETMQLLMKEGGLGTDEAYWKIRDWDYKQENPDAGSGEYKYLYDAFDNAYETGKLSERDVMQEEITALVEHGKKPESVAGRITNHYKFQYLELKAAGRCADMKNLLISAYMMLGLSKDEAMEKIDGWEEVEE